jgi:uncharacterized protein YecE (DUF72 family)
MTSDPIRIGCAGWAIPKAHAASFPGSGSHLERYAQVFNALEINSSFHRPHRRATYERWAASVPAHFSFAVKAPKRITHELHLVGTEMALDEFLTQADGLGPKLGPLLFQLPPKFGFDPLMVRAFFAALRARHGGDVVCEPRHADWFALAADDLLAEFRIARAAADPALVSAEPGGWKKLVYFRLHGSPRVYWSEYTPRPDRPICGAVDARRQSCALGLVHLRQHGVRCGNCECAGDAKCCRETRVDRMKEARGAVIRSVNQLR